MTVIAVDSNSEVAAFISLNENYVQLFNIDTYTYLNTFSNHTNDIKWVLFSPYKDEFYTCGLDGLVVIYESDGAGNYEASEVIDLSVYGQAYSLNANI